MWMGSAILKTKNDDKKSPKNAMKKQGKNHLNMKLQSKCRKKQRSEITAIVI